jgi:hypothetical protein
VGSASWEGQRAIEVIGQLDLVEQAVGLLFIIAHIFLLDLVEQALGLLFIIAHIFLLCRVFVAAEEAAEEAAKAEW